MPPNRQARPSPDERFKDAVPEPTAFTFVPTYDEFAAWCRHPVTGYVATAMNEIADRYQKEWAQLSWDQGTCDPLILTRYKAFAEAYRSFSLSKRDDYVNILQA